MLPNFGEIPRPNWIEIDLDNLQSNIRFVQSILSKKTKILMPVKADAYGHGSLAISLAAIEAGVDFLGVAHLFEGVALREHGIKARILILEPCLPSDFSLLVKYNLTPSVQDFETANCLNQNLQNLNNFQNCSKFRVHVQVDTGMHRFGIDYDNFEEVKKICELPNLEVEGIYSHLATADIYGHPAMDIQLSRFEKLLNSIGKRPPVCHIANSPATFSFNKTHYDMVRPGVSLYGYDPAGNFPSSFPIKPVLRLRATVRSLREVAEGEGISYGHFFVAKKNMRVATIAIGYGDGYLRGEPSKGVIFVRGKPCPILGRVCMDACMIDASGVPEMQTGDIAECINGEISEHISVEAFAKEHHTISYEITTRMARRLYRLYKYKGETTGWDDLGLRPCE